MFSAVRLGFDEAAGEHFFVAKPEIGNIGGPEAENVFEGAADLGQVKIDADALEQRDEIVGAFRQQRAGTYGFGVQAVAVDNVNGLRTCAMPYDVEKAIRSGLGR